VLTEELNDAHADDSNMSHSVLDETKTAWGKQLARRVGGKMRSSMHGHTELVQRIMARTYRKAEITSG